MTRAAARALRALAACAALGGAAQGCVVSTGPEGTPERSEDSLLVDAGAHCHERATLILDGVTCPSCGEVVRANLLALDGVVAAQVSLSPPQAEVVYCDQLDTGDLVHAVRDAGYGAHVD
jgi:Cu+-exporting ATPase